MLAADPVRILCIGDSITQGGRADREEWTYRLPLQEMLLDAGVNFDFIGTRSEGLQPDAKWPDVKGKAFDPDHEGYYGAKTAYVRDRMKEFLPKLPDPDIALIHLGTNDQGSEDFTAEVVEPLEEIIGMLREKNPGVRVMVGHLNMNGGPAMNLRPLIEKMAKRLDTQNSTVVTVPTYEGWIQSPDEEGTDTFDWAHPNPQGQRKMARAFFDAMKPYLPEK